MRIPKRPQDKKVQIGIKAQYLLDAGAAGCDSIETYIEALKTTIRKLQDANTALNAQAGAGARGAI